MEFETEVIHVLCRTVSFGCNFSSYLSCFILSCTVQICIRKGEEYGDALRKLILDDRLVPDREDVLALIDYHHDNPVKMQDFLQRLDAGIPYQYISDRVLPELRRTEIRVCLSYPEENGGKNSSAEQAARIEETEFIPIDRETTVTPMTMQVLPQKERTQVIMRISS